MNKIEEKSKEYIHGYGDGYAPEGIDVGPDPNVEERGFTLEDGERIFIDGANWALNNQWNKIERDKYGFATDKCLDEIFKNENILFHLKDNIIELANAEYEDWRGDIERKTRYDYWMAIKMPNNGS